MTFIEYIFLFFLFFTGYFFITAFLGYGRLLRNLAGAFPIGCCLWGATTFLTTALTALPKDVYGLSLPVAMLLTVLLGIASLIVSTRRHGLKTENIIAGTGGFIIISFLYWLFIQFNLSVLSGDSLNQIHPQIGLKAWGDVRGFNQSIAALAGLSGQDRYFFPYHPIFAISLIFITAECIFHEVKSATSLGPAMLTSLVGPLLMASCHITAINAFYVNNHMLVTVLIILALSVLIGCIKYMREQPEIAQPMAVLGAIIVSFLCLLRLEGQLIAFLLLVITLGHPEVNPTVRMRAFLVFALLTSPFQLFMVFCTAGKVSAANFALILLATLLFPIAFSLNSPRWVLHLQRHANKYALLGIGIGVILFFAFNPGKMMYRCEVLFQNMLDESYWGFVYQTLFIAALAIFVLRFFFHEPQMLSTHRRMDLILLFYMGSLLLVVFMLNFHGARPGWSDSQNRMLIHFLPTGILWVSIQAGLGFAGQARKRTDAGIISGNN